MLTEVRRRLRCGVSAAAGLRHALQRQVQPVVARPFSSSSPASNLGRYASARRRGSAPPEPLADTFMQLNKPRSPDRDSTLTKMTASRARHHATVLVFLRA